MNNPNLQSLIKIANAFDLYDHQHYAYRHNKNNPKITPVNILKEDISREQSFNIDVQEQNVKGMPDKPINKKAPKWSKEQTHVFKQKPSVNGTGGGPAYGKERKNPFQPF